MKLAGDTYEEVRSPQTECASLLSESRRSKHSPRTFDPRKVDMRVQRGVIVLLLVLVALIGAASFNFLILNKKSGTQHVQHSTALTVQLEGKHKDDDDDDDTTGKISHCNDGDYSSRTLKLAYELPFASLFKDSNGSRKFEASSVVLSQDHKFAYTICDSSWAIFKFGIQLTPFSDNNSLIEDVDRELDEDSGFEALVLHNDTFYVIRESVDHTAINGSLEGYHAIIEEVQVLGDTYKTIRKCSAEFEFEGDSKGFEGAAGLTDLDGNFVILGLCEGNHCSESRKDDVGHGRIVAMRQEVSDDGSCLWKTIRKIHLPHSASFTDYSDINIAASGKVAVTSQEDSQLWISRLLGHQNDGRWDIDNLNFDDSYVEIYDFPKDNTCSTVYCNIEGIHWINDDTVIAVSDKMKGNGKQDFRCFEKDQSVHVFMLPDTR